MSLADSVAAIHDQGGLAMIPHPFMPFWFASCQEGMLARLLETQTVDAIETEHTAPTTAARQAALHRFYELHRAGLGAAVGGSDCHFGRHDIDAPWEETNRVDDLRKASEKLGAAQTA